MINTPAVEGGLLACWTDRLRALPGPPAVGVLLRGSHARGAATAYSDLDLDLLVAGGSYQANPAFLGEAGGHLVHVSVAVRDVESWFARLRTPAPWSFGLPVDTPARLLWAADGWRDRLDLCRVRQPAGEPRLEDLVAGLGKLCAAYAGADDAGIRLVAGDLARACPPVLRLANPPITVASRREAVEAVLGLPVVPPGYDADMRLCLGLRAGTGAQVYAAGRRLVAGVVPLVRPYADVLAASCGRDLAAALLDGRLDRYLEQLAADPVAG